jgi:hypothetical protein
MWSFVRLEMRLALLLSICGLLAATLRSGAEEFSQVHDLPPLKMGATDLDSILVKTHSLVDAANGPDELGQESVKIDIHSQDIEIPHLSLASSLAFPNETFGFSYTYQQPDKPITSIIINLGDSLRRISVSGGSPDKVEQLSSLLDKDFRRHATAAGGIKFRRVAGICLSMLFLSSLMIGGAYCWNNRDCRVALGVPICSAIGFLLVLFVPWNRFLPGFVLYQRYSPFFLIRHAAEISVLGIVASLAGIPIFYLLSRKKR